MMPKVPGNTGKHFAPLCGAARNHVIPVNDLREHDLVATCWCRPEVDDDHSLVIHNSMDRREDYETGERKAS